MNAEAVTMIGKQIRGKLSFLRMLALVRKTLTRLPSVSVNSPRLTPGTEVDTVGKGPSMPARRARINSEKINVWAEIMAIGCKISHAAAAY